MFISELKLEQPLVLLQPRRSGSSLKTFKGLLLIPWCVGLIYTLLFIPIQVYQLGDDHSYVVKPILIRVKLY